MNHSETVKLPQRCNGCTREQLQMLGIVFGEPIDDVYIQATLPAGWHCVPLKSAGDYYSSELLDEHDRPRAIMFHKRAFWDRHAHIVLYRRFNVSRRYSDDYRVVRVVVLESHDTEHFTTEAVEQNLASEAYLSWSLAAERRAIDWLDVHYPKWRDPLAYWDNEETAHG